MATVASFLTGEGEAAAVSSRAAKTLAGAESRAAYSPELKAATSLEINSIAKPSNPLFDNPAGYADQRSAELQGASNSGSRIALSAGVLENPTTGERVVAVGTSENNGYLRPGVTLKPGEILTRGPAGRHAERDVVYYAQRHRLKVIAVGAGIPHCPACQDLLEQTGGIIASARRARR